MIYLTLVLLMWCMWTDYLKCSHSEYYVNENYCANFDHLVLYASHLNGLSGRSHQQLRLGWQRYRYTGVMICMLFECSADYMQPIDQWPLHIRYQVESTLSMQRIKLGIAKLWKTQNVSNHMPIAFFAFGNLCW